MLQRVFEQIRRRHEAIKGLLCRNELDKHINITVGASLVANTEAPDFGLNGL